MHEGQYEHYIEQLGTLRDRLRQLEDVDYMTAYYKGYSASGMTLEEIRRAIIELTEEMSELESRMEETLW
ncbi:hypothetical protein [Enterococcus sp. DIV0876]|uniref:hypothetical protein n=1 Tax=Enterococcus sp. DIV0876 TaxID=2774633 RepID=UPI003D3006E2